MADQQCERDIALNHLQDSTEYGRAMFVHDSRNGAVDSIIDKVGLPDVAEMQQRRDAFESPTALSDTFSG